MTAAFMRARQEIAQFALCLLVGILCGGILLFNLPLKWQFAVFGALGLAVPVLLAQSPQRPLLFALAFTVPIYFGKAFIIRLGPASLSSGVSIFLTDVLALALLLLLLIKLALRRATIRFVPMIMIPALGWLVSSSLSLLAARDTGFALIQLINTGKLLLLGWVVANSVVDEADLMWVIRGLMLGLLFQALVGIYQGVIGRPVGLDFLTETNVVHEQELSVGLVNRVQGTIGHPNSYAMYLTTVMPFALALLLSATRGSLKVLAGITFCLSCMALVYSLSRTAWVNSLVMFSVVLALAVRRKRITSQAAVLMAGTALLILLALMLFGPDIILARLTSDDRGSTYSRVTQSRIALRIIQDHPLVGVGLNNYVLASAEYGPANSVSWSGAPVVHNLFLLIAAETGFVGLTAFLVFLAILLVGAWRIISRAPDDTVWVAGVGIFAACVALAVHGMADYALLGSLQTITQFWLLAGLCAALSQCVDDERQHARRVSYSSDAMSPDLRSY